MKVLKKIILFLFACSFIVGLGSKTASAAENYVALDSKDPIDFQGNSIIYKGKTIELNEKAFYIDGSLDEATAAKYPYVFTSINEAAKHLTDGTEKEPMMLYIAPYVYWVDDPDDTEIRKPDTLSVPYGLIIDCEWLTFYGLTDNPENVVIAANRGQTQGADGNFTNLYIDGNGTRMENLTVGNYCNVDLKYPLKSELNREKRSDAITQAQLVHCNGDKVVAMNCNFISRLNANPIISSQRVLLYRCHVESTDDALNGTTVHLECDFDFYGNRPFYSTQGTGSVFLNCIFNSKIFGIEAEPNQFLTKEGGAVTIVDSEFKSNYSVPINIGWTKYPKSSLRCYQSNVLHNGKPVTLSTDNPWSTIDMTKKEVLGAYKVVLNGETIYNTYNLLRGNDDWDPMGVKELILAASKEDGKDYTSIPTLLSIETSNTEIESGNTEATLTYSVKRFGNIDTKLPNISWSIDEESEALVKLIENKDGSCTVKGINDYDEAKTVIVYAKSKTGLEAACEIKVSPSVLASPDFIKKPEIKIPVNGKVSLSYTLDLGKRADQSVITWYRCTDKKGSNKIPVSVTNLNMPEYTYELTLGDVGYYLMATIEPKHVRSHAGKAVTVVTSDKIQISDVKQHSIATDFQNFPVEYNATIAPGFWTVDSIKPSDTKEFEWEPDTTTSWIYGSAIDGAKGTGLYQTTQGARLLYTPLDGNYKDMTVTLTLDPSKTQGQGFGSAKAQYLDVYIKFDTKTLTGYALRIERTSKSSRAVDFLLVKYENGETTRITEPITASCYLTDCNITLKVEGNKLSAHVETSTPQLPEHIADGLPHVVDLTATIETNEFGGSGVLHTGTTGSSGVGNITMLHNMSISWDGINDILSLDTEELPDTNTNGNTSTDTNGNASSETNNSTNTDKNSNISKENGNSTENTHEIPKTGDNSLVTVSIIGICVLVAGVFFLISKRKLKKIL